MPTLPTVQVNPDLCVHCGVCLNACFAGLLEFSETTTPRFIESGAQRCFRCQHCMASCPTGALSWSGKDPNQGAAMGPIAKSDEMANLLRQRRTIRKYVRKNVEPEILNQLTSAMDFVPTGCNDHRLFLSISADLAATDAVRQAAIDSVLKQISEHALPAGIEHFGNLKSALEKRIDVFFRGAPHFVAISVPPESKDAHIDPYIAASQFELLANAFGLGTCWGGMATDLFLNNDDLRSKLNIPTTHVLKIVLLFGYPAERFARLPQPEPCQTVFVQG